MAYVEVEIDIDEFETEEIVTELIRRLKTWKTKNVPTDKQNERVLNELRDLFRRLGGTGETFPQKTLEDKMKAEYLKSIWDKYTAFQLEEKLK
jgi:hypothetical protein